LTREGKEEDDEVNQRVIAKSIVSRSEPADVGERYEEKAVEDRETKGGAIIYTED